jgi:hypothetical protein
VRFVRRSIRVAARAVVRERAVSGIEAIAGDQVGVRVAVRLLRGGRPIGTDPLRAPVGPGVRLEAGRAVAGRSGCGMLVGERAPQLGRDGAQARLREAIVGQAHATSCAGLPHSLEPSPRHPREKKEPEKAASAALTFRRQLVEQFPVQLSPWRARSEASPARTSPMQPLIWSDWPQSEGRRFFLTPPGQFFLPATFLLALHTCSRFQQGDPFRFWVSLSQLLANNILETNQIEACTDVVPRRV